MATIMFDRRPALQQPEYDDRTGLWLVRQRLRYARGLVHPRAINALSRQLVDVAEGRAYGLRGGDCAEPFGGSVAPRMAVMMQMKAIITYVGGVPVVVMGREANYGKPRSAELDADGLPVYRGEMINSSEATLEARRADPWRMWRAYRDSQMKLAEIDRLVRSGFVGLARLHDWNADWDTPQGKRYEGVAAEIDRALHFMEICGVDVAGQSTLQVASYTGSHEALALEYERPLVRWYRGKRYATSGHMLWIGERTRQLDGAHVAFCAGIANPIGVKIGPTADPDEVVELCRRLNPDNIPGRLTIISRMGASKICDKLPEIVRRVRDAGCKVIWECDPMHGNGSSHEGFKTRHYGDIESEVKDFSAICKGEGVWPGSLHLELSGRRVTEVWGGGFLPVSKDNLGDCYETACDPRMNLDQSLELAFLVAELLRQR